MDTTTMHADLTARLAALERQQSDTMALFRAAHVLGAAEGRLAELREVLAGMTPDPPTDDGPDTTP